MYTNKENYEKVPGVVYESKSETIPEQALSIEDMLKRHSNGLTIPIDHRLEWIDGELPPRMEDLTDIDEARKMIIEMEEKLNRKKEVIDKKEEEIIEEVEEVVIKD